MKNIIEYVFSKCGSLIGLFLLFFILTTMQAFAQNTKVYLERGGAKQVILSGGEVEVRTGGLIDMQAGSTLTVNAAATINIADAPTFSNLSVTYGVGAATGVYSGALSAASIAATAHTGATLSLTGAADINGAVTMGADNTVSTMAANGALTVHASVTAPAITGTTSIGVPATGMVFVGLRTIAQLQAATAVAGELGICSTCSPVEVFISTGAGAPNTGGYGNAAGAQLD